MASRKGAKWGQWDTFIITLYLASITIAVSFIVYEPNAGQTFISGLAIGSFVFVVLGSQIQYKPLNLKLLWGTIFTMQFVVGSTLMVQAETQTHQGSWANSLFLGPAGLLLVLALDRISLGLHKDHFAMLSRGGIDTGTTGRRRYRGTDILFSVLSFVLPFPLAEWLFPMIIDLVIGQVFT
jgi:hypothetical protein